MEIRDNGGLDGSCWTDEIYNNGVLPFCVYLKHFFFFLVLYLIIFSKKIGFVCNFAV